MFVSDNGQSQIYSWNKYSCTQRMPLPNVGGDWLRCSTEYLHFLPVQAEDYDTPIAGPRREERLRRTEEKMNKSIWGFRGERQTLRGVGPVSSSLGQRQLHDYTTDSQRQLVSRHHVTGDSSGVVSHGSCVTERDESGDSHVTDQSE